MELSTRYKLLLQGYSRLDYMSKTFIELSKVAVQRDSFSDEENEFVTHRDALIKRFEFCYELTWKFLKQLLKERYSIDATSPRSVFNACYEQNIVTREEMGLLLDMIDSRNETTHVYDESKANAISLKIIEYYALLKSIINTIEFN